MNGMGMPFHNIRSITFYNNDGQFQGSENNMVPIQTNMHPFERMPRERSRDRDRVQSKSRERGAKPRDRRRTKDRERMKEAAIEQQRRLNAVGLSANGDTFAPPK